MYSPTYPPISQVFFDDRNREVVAAIDRQTAAIVAELKKDA